MCNIKSNSQFYVFRDPNDMQIIRRMTGVCPQHDILFDLLTPREHLEFFAAVRVLHFSQNKCLQILINLNILGYTKNFNRIRSK